LYYQLLLAIITISFNDDVFNGLTTVVHDDDDSFGSLDGSEDRGCDSRVSALEFDGDIKTERPDRILFGEGKCHRQVTLYKNDAAELVRICGNRFGACARGHMGVVRFGEEVYKTLAGKGNHFIDGMGGTCISKEEYDKLLGQEAAERGKSIAEAGVTLELHSGGEDSLKPSSSKESGYKSAYGNFTCPSLAKGRLKTPPKAEPTIKPTAIYFPTPTVKAKGPHLGLGVPKATTGVNGVAAGLPKTAQSGLREPKKITAKVEKATVKKEMSVDPMVLVVKPLATSLGNLDVQMKHMTSSISELQSQLKKEVSKTKEVVRPEEHHSDQYEKNLGGPFYTVARGREGHQGIYQSWSECAAWVAGVPGNVIQKVGTLELAHDFIEQYNAGQMGRQKEGHGGNLFRKGLGRNEGVHPRSNEMHQGNKELADHLGEVQSKTHSRPDLKYLGPDPSTKKEEEFYGVDATTVLDVVNVLLPSRLEQGLKKGICQAVTDVVALPGGYQTNAFDGEEGLALFTQSMAEMAHGGRAENEIFGKPDFNW
jgi:hypothetical protein